jgi:hypothetical protein
MLTHARVRTGEQGELSNGEERATEWRDASDRRSSREGVASVSRGWRRGVADERTRCHQRAVEDRGRARRESGEVRRGAHGAEVAVRVVAAGSSLLHVHGRNAAVGALGERGGRDDEQLRRCHDSGDSAHCLA